MRTQKRILDLLNARSEQAIEEMKTHYGGLCSSIAGRILDSREDVDEIINDTFLSVWNSIPPNQPLSLPAYISRIIRRNALNRLEYNRAKGRNEAMTLCMDELELVYPAGRSPEETLESKQITQVINGYLATLSRQNRIIFVRRYYCMDSTAQIAELTGMTDTAIRSRLLRMRAELRAKLEKEDIFV